MQRVRVNGQAMFDKIYDDYLSSEYSNWVTFLRQEYEITRPTMDRILETGEIATKNILNKLNKRIDVNSYRVA